MAKQLLFLIFSIIAVFAATITRAQLVIPNEQGFQIKITNMDSEEGPILQGPATINDIIPMEKDLTIFVDCMRMFSDIVSKF